MTKDVLERKLKVDQEERKGFKLAKKIVSAGVAGLTAWCISMPLDVVKSIIQSEPEKKQSAWSTAIALYKKKGIKKFYSGLAPQACRIFPQSASMLLVYEWSYQKLVV
jgi:solute carrier family 25 2-oxodicarboxylate transporter 21